MALPNGDATMAAAGSGLSQPYMVPGLRKNSRQNYQLVRRMVSAGMVEASLDCICQVGLFVVTKRSGHQRLVVDCRLTKRGVRPTRLGGGLLAHGGCQLSCVSHLKGGFSASGVRL